MGYHRARNKKDPREDCYYSSSKTVKNLLKEHGISCFKKKIIGLYSSSSEAINKEVEYHARLKVDSNLNFLNIARQTTTKFFYDNAGRVQTEESNKKRSTRLMGVNKMTQKGKDSVSNYQSNIRIRSEQEREILRQNAIKRNQESTICPYCKKVGQRPAILRWHFDNSKLSLFSR
jgi:YD repeat-containing protein